MNPPPGTGQVRCEREGRIAWVTLSNPGKLNALSVAMWRALQRIFEALAADDGVGCVVLRGENGNFAAGADISEFPQARADFDGVYDYHVGMIAPALRAIGQCPHPVLAQIEGVCVGGGLEVASQCDMRIAGESARFGVPITRLGFSMAPHEMQGLLALAGKAVTLEILYEGRVFGAAEAQGKGLLNRVVADADVAGAVRQSVERILRGSPIAARLNKRTANLLDRHGVDLDPAQLRACFDYADTHDHKEGVRAFLAGEEPVFKGA
ncbi:enoyl-CoA hydratase-related protein [Orrella sp. JC864]|uniref:enoyl-CoA hydratase/isomerase family protein n=1 Tax=Orrella sp. JC864 TaxID=3120298 RepID=UPI003009761B